MPKKYITSKHLYKKALRLANKILLKACGMTWGDFPDTVSLSWHIDCFLDYPMEGDKAKAWHNNVSESDVAEAVRNACIDRVAESGYGNQKEIKDIIRDIDNMRVELATLF